MTERTLVLIKPPISRNIDAILRIFTRFVNAGLRPIRTAEQTLWDDQFSHLYGEHRGKSFFPLMRGAYLNQVFIAVCFEGDSAIYQVRRLNGATDPLKADPGTIRRDFGDLVPRNDGFSTPYNAVHGSDSAASASREIKIFFPDL